MQEQLNTDDTIVAIASTRGGLRGVIRLSGPHALSCLQTCTNIGVPSSVGSRHCSGMVKLGPPFGDVCCEIYTWPTKQSYTQQPSAELHLSGSPPLLNAALRTLCDAGARLARRGEFTLRAFLGGRLDLPQAEAVLGVIDSETPAELQTALGQLSGGLTGKLHIMRDMLLNLLADLEAGLDFVEEDIEFVSSQTIAQTLRACRETAGTMLEQIRNRSERGQHPRVALIGMPNVGKSSLFNALIRSSSQSTPEDNQPSESGQALVSSQAGTTRDYVTCRVTWEGLTLELIDTAGTGHVGTTIDERSHAARQRVLNLADAVVHCRDASNPELGQDTLIPEGSQVVRVETKIDLVTQKSGLAVGELPWIATSSATGAGLDEVRSAIVVAGRSAQRAAFLDTTAGRCEESVQRLAISLDGAIEAAEAEFGEEIVAGEIRASIQELAVIVGAVYTDDILDRLFSRFCIGK